MVFFIVRDEYGICRGFYNKGWVCCVFYKFCVYLRFEIKFYSVLGIIKKGLNFIRLLE